LRLLAVCGSLRRASYNGALLGAAAADPPSGTEVVVWRDLASIPPFSEDLEPAPPTSVVSLRDEISRSDAVLIATPEYNGSVPGALKNALDWVSRPFAVNALRDKPVAVVGASQGLFGAVRAQAELRRILKAIGARVQERDLPVARAHEAFTADGQLRDPRLAASLRAIVADLVCSAEQRAA
jgi:chromate reductase